MINYLVKIDNYLVKSYRTINLLFVTLPVSLSRAKHLAVLRAVIESLTKVTIDVCPPRSWACSCALHSSLNWPVGDSISSQQHSATSPHMERSFATATKVGTRNFQLQKKLPCMPIQRRTCLNWTKFS